MTIRRCTGRALALLVPVAAALGFSVPASAFPLGSSIAKALPTPSLPPAAGDAASSKLATAAADHLLPEMVDQAGNLVFKMMTRNTGEVSDSFKTRARAVCDNLTKQAKTGRYSAAAKVFNWEVKVVQGDAVNAYAFPGGKILVYTGLLQYTNNDDAKLAIALGHEIVHGLARHAAQRLSKELQREIALAYTGKRLADGGLPPEAVAGLMVAMGVAHEGAVMRPYSRELESEADHEGLLLAARAGFDPAPAVDFWKGRKDLPKGKTGNILAFLMAHPSDDARIRQLEAWMPEAATLRPAAGQQARSASGGPSSGRTR